MLCTKTTRRRASAAIASFSCQDDTAMCSRIQAAATQIKFGLSDASKNGDLDAPVCLVDERKVEACVRRIVRPGGSRDGLGRFRRCLLEGTASIQAWVVNSWTRRVARLRSAPSPDLCCGHHGSQHLLQKRWLAHEYFSWSSTFHMLSRGLASLRVRDFGEVHHLLFLR